MNRSALTTFVDSQVPASRRPLRVLGIDLGTTNSAVAEIIVLPDGSAPLEARCLDIEQDTRQGPYNHTLVPSVLAIQNGKVYVGKGAKDMRARAGNLKLSQNMNIFWDCKNDIGVRRTYHKAPPGFGCAKEIAQHLLKFMMDSVTDSTRPPVNGTVVTVPASFQAAQRRDTLNAAVGAGIELPEGALIDEPIAAFLEYLASEGTTSFATASGAQRLVVFDFGGGTCDVAVFELRSSQASGRRGLGVAPLAVSRYHRLGGGDIDRAIILDVLIPQLVEQNSLKPHDLDYFAKSTVVIPALLGCAESLKIGLSREISRLKKFGRYDKERSTLVQKNPGTYPCTLSNGRSLHLHSPTLSAEQFENVLRPFLDRDLLHHRETEYSITCSVFAPLQDALQRAGLDPVDVNFCLLVGGSALIPQIPETVTQFLTEARLLCFGDAERTLSAVARGAAWQALSLALHGHGLVHPITSDTIGIQTESGLVTLIPSGTELPYPSDDDWAECDRLVAPESGLDDELELRVRLRSSDGRSLLSSLWPLPAVVSKGDPLKLRYRMDANQVLELHISFGDMDISEDDFRETIENPLSSVVNPNAKSNEILDLEEQMRSKNLTPYQEREIVEKLADLETELGHFEKAFGYLVLLNQRDKSAHLLHKMGILAGRMNDFERQEKIYREAARIAPDIGAPLFNLALEQRYRGKLDEAMQSIDEAIMRQPAPPFLVLKATLLDKLKQLPSERDALLKRAFVAFNPMHIQTDWELHWYGVAAKLAADPKKEQEADEERIRRRKNSPEEDGGALPVDIEGEALVHRRTT